MQDMKMCHEQIKYKINSSSKIVQTDLWTHSILYYIYIYQYHLSISIYVSQMPNFPSSISTPNFQPAIVERQLSQQHPGRPHRCARSWKKQRARSSLRCSTARTRGRSVWARFLEVKRLRVSAINHWYDMICISKLSKQIRVMDELN